VLADAVGFVTDHEHELRRAGVDRRVDRVGDERAIRDREHRLRDRLGERPHPRPLAGREDDCLHVSLIARAAGKTYRLTVGRDGWMR